jgi:hypothetical protein
LKAYVVSLNRKFLMEGTVSDAVAVCVRSCWAKF